MLNTHYEDKYAQQAILRLDIGGMPREWISFESAAYYYAKGLVGWTHGEPFKVLHGGTGRSGSPTVMDLHPVIAVKGKTPPKRIGPPPLNNPTLFRRDEHLCMYCGQAYPKSMLTRDHVIPASRGGEDKWSNVTTACKSCNSVKGARTPEEAGMPLLAVPYTPNPFEYLYLLRNRHIQADQMEFLRGGFRHERLF
ncbi:HNH endonuclease [Acidithiobacillus thiooxidans]|uniref:HNH endonuclease n=1 Tax=Acidithiobacillus thiooxidans TaxID=930 RepID=A0A1C2J1U4_ACITH|nr:HNH endonuclease [Acidithiobacillus thiooxidans]OCX68622.1 HNH endonuclease [Acidithiobacillus thiooxidans]OCX78154.1 HNH endonuclease [Acidithiobacillus thiooxidans]OCX82223.1 HNH endonuclease [Acidithiobacillus thiooxidans]OCX88727.1 HNH endonuclease [Acidithiobacillus thiooxidans]OFC50189.1 HNH endonuclease [Acidithiobacillus thiooxidans]